MGLESPNPEGRGWGPARSALGTANIDYLARIRGHVQALAEEAGLESPAEFARSRHILMKESITSAAEGDTRASDRARQMGAWLIAHHQPR